jgi:hypothetical protein
VEWENISDVDEFPDISDIGTSFGRKGYSPPLVPTKLAQDAPRNPAPPPGPEGG